MKEAKLNEIRNDFLNGDYEKIKKDVSNALDANIDPKDILEKGLMKSITEIGQLFDKGERFVPDLLISAEIMKNGLDILKPYLDNQESLIESGTVLIGTVEGDVHDIGKNLVASMLEGSGFKVIDLGVDVKIDQFISEAKKEKPDIIAMSSLISITIGAMADVISSFKKEGIRGSYKFLLGGAVVDEAFTKESGADAYGDNAFQAVVQAKKLMSELKGVK
jgi:corrinoid protein of di/trimethylamine methyltransferase